MIKSKHLESLLHVHKDDIAEDLMDEVYSRQITEKMKFAVEQLSPQCREALTLSRYEHLSYKQIAEKMGISVSTVEKHISKALASLRQDFQEFNLPVLILIGLIEMIMKR